MNGLIKFKIFLSEIHIFNILMIINILNQLKGFYIFVQ